MIQTKKTFFIIVQRIILQKMIKRISHNHTVNTINIQKALVFRLLFPVCLLSGSTWEEGGGGETHILIRTPTAKGVGSAALFNLFEGPPYRKTKIYDRITCTRLRSTLWIRFPDHWRTSGVRFTQLQVKTRLGWILSRCRLWNIRVFSVSASKS